jgi:hypothetical protein
LGEIVVEHGGKSITKFLRKQNKKKSKCIVNENFVALILQNVFALFVPTLKTEFWHLKTKFCQQGNIGPCKEFTRK